MESPRTSVVSPRVKANYHFFSYKYANGCLVLTDPRNGQTRIFPCPKVPASLNEIITVLRAGGFAKERHIRCADKTGTTPCGEPKRVRFVLVEKALPRTGIIQIPASESLVKRPVCDLCATELGAGIRCDTCKKEWCAACKSDMYSTSENGIPDSSFAVRLLILPRCDYCLKI